jgi:hypothetical protein
MVSAAMPETVTTDSSPMPKTKRTSALCMSIFSFIFESPAATRYGNRHFSLAPESDSGASYKIV